MRARISPVWALVLVAGGLAPSRVQAAQPAELKAFYRSGQTFVTWKESGAAQYHVYRSDKRITDVASAEKVATVAKGSSAYDLETKRKFAAKYTGKPGYNQRFVIEDNPGGDEAKMLPADTGLYVHTCKGEGAFHYAVVADGETSLSDANSLASPVAEKVEPIGAVLIYREETKDKKKDEVTGERRIYTQWMDAGDWNAQPDGGYAYNFSLGVPKEKARGLVVRMHGYSGYYEYTGPMQGLAAIGFGDPYQTWFYGHRDESGKTVVNYTERRLLLTAEFALRQLEAEGHAAVRNKVYTFGCSMGGTGGNFHGAWHGELFGAVQAVKGAVDHNRNGKWTATSERLLWGAKGDALKTREGVPVWDHLNLCTWHVENMGKETAFILDTHASNDESVPFGAMPDYYEALQKAKRPFVAQWAPWGHAGNNTIERWPNHKWWGMFSFNNNETVPAIGFASTNDDPRQTKAGHINWKIEFWARENDFDQAKSEDNTVDEPERWEMCLRSCNGAAKQTATVTPRRCQKFKTQAGKTYRWENVSLADPALPSKVAEGTVAADEHGLVSVENFEINKEGWGNRLVIFAEK